VKLAQLFARCTLPSPPSFVSRTTMLNLLLPVVVGYAGSMDGSQLEACATLNCQGVAPHGDAPQAGNALTATGKVDGGSYTPCETISLAVAGANDQTEYVLYASSAGVQLVLATNGAAEARAPLSGALALLGMRANGQAQVTYETITLNSDGNTPPGGACPEPPPPPPPPPYVAPPPYGGVANYPPPPPLSGTGEQLTSGGTLAGLGMGGGFAIGLILGVALVFAVVLYFKRSGKPPPAWFPMPPSGRAGGPPPSAGGKTSSIVAVSLGPSSGPPPTTATRAAALSSAAAPPAHPQPSAPANLPEGWTVENDASSGREYFYNTQTGASSWTRPS
jgi:hypothetical protein